MAAGATRLPNILPRTSIELPSFKTPESLNFSNVPVSPSVLMVSWLMVTPNCFSASCCCLVGLASPLSIIRICVPAYDPFTPLSASVASCALVSSILAPRVFASGIVLAIASPNSVTLVADVAAAFDITSLTRCKFTCNSSGVFAASLNPELLRVFVMMSAEVARSIALACANFKV